MHEELPHHDLAIVGSGFAGLGMAIEAKRAGIEQIIVLERADTLGGTWRDNHYPGLRLRRADAAVFLFVRAEPVLVTPVRAQRRDSQLPGALR